MDETKSDRIEKTTGKKRFTFGLMGAGIATYLAVFAFLGLLGWGSVKTQKGQVQSGLAPDFTLRGYDGKEITLSNLRGQVVVINFWASWCTTCRDEAAYLEQTWQDYQGKGAVFLGVDYLDTEKEALAYMQEFDITYINGPDVGTRISQSYNIQGVPETFYIDKKGNLSGLKIGPLEPPELEEKIEELLSEPYNGE